MCITPDVRSQRVPCLLKRSADRTLSPSVWSLLHRLIDSAALLRDAMTLTDLQRAELAAELLASLEGPTADDVDAVRARWSAQIEPRAQHVVSGSAEFESWDNLRQRMAHRYDG